MFVHEGSNRHTLGDLPIVVACHGVGTLQPGRHAKFGGRPMRNLFLSFAERMGVGQLSAFGDATGKLDGI